MPAIAVLFLCAPLGLALGRLAVLLAPLALAAAALLAIPADEARADSGHPGGNFPLHCAAGIDGDLAVVVHLLGSGHGIDVNARNPSETHYPCSRFYRYGQRDTPLHEAAIYGRATIAATLIAAGADVNAKNDHGWTPLQVAARSVVSVLLAAGADVNARDNVGLTPLHRAAQAGFATIAATLIAAGAEVNAKNDHGWTPLRGTWDDFRNEFYFGLAAVASVLIAAGGHWGEACAEPLAVNPAHHSPPCLCESPNVGTVDNCQPPNPSVEVCGGLAPPKIYNAAAEVCEASVELGVEFCGGLTPPKFYDAAAGVCVSYKPCYRGTLDRKTNTCECAGAAVLDGAGNNCECLAPNLDWSVGDCRAPSVENCAEFYAPPRFYDASAGECTDPLYPCHDSAVVNADNSGCECAPGDYAHGDPSGGAECHADHAPLAHDLDGWTAAITLDDPDPELVSHFIADHGQDPDADYALHLAARHSAFGIAKLLLQRGANPDAANPNGDTPLHEAARLSDTPENVALVSLLLDKGANPNIGNNDRWRPLDLAYGRTDSFPPRRKMMAALIIGEADWASECTGGTIPNGNYQGAAEASTYPRCGCPAHISQRDSFGNCECPSHSHAQVNGRCLAKDSAQVALEIAKMRLELEQLRAALAELNLQVSLAADGPPEMLEEVAKQAEVAARGIARLRNNFLALAQADLAEADDAGPAPMLALSDTEATCRMLDGEVQTHSRSGTKICSGIDHNDTFCIVGSDSAFPCMGFFRHVRRCNDGHNRPALDPWHCAKKCEFWQRARGAGCAIIN